MRQLTNIFILLLGVICTSPSFAIPQDHHELFLKAENQLNKRQYQNFHLTMADLEHPLKPYLTARWIRKHFYKTPTQEIDQFLKQHKDQPVAIRLNRQWIKYLAKKQRWHLFLDYYQPNNNLALQCNHISALENTNQHFSALTIGQALWLKGVSLPKECDRVFKNWKRIGYLTPELIWDRLIAAQENKQYKLVRYLKKQLPNALRKQFSIMQNSWRRPLQTFKDSRLAKLDKKVRYSLLKRAIKFHPEYLHDTNINPIFSGLTSTEKDTLELIAINASTNIDDTNLYQWYQLAKNKNLLNSDLEQAFLLGAVKNQQWSTYSHIYKLSSQEIKDKGKWLYWNARALNLLGASENITTPFYQLASSNRDYYGFLASQQLGISASMNHTPTHVNASTLQQTRLHPSVKRALAFLDLKRIHQARREWQHAFNQLDYSGRQALALLAGRLEWSDRAIMSLAQLKDWHDLQLRFPLAHEPLFDQAAKRNKIEKTWIYGIARQESAFMHDAKSPVGATGLMQLMPATAKYVSRSLRIKYSNQKLLDPTYNIRLGSRYLTTLLKKYKGNKVLATAAYNAGPGNVKRWLKRFNGPLDIWIERIPFNETKEYVQRVLAYSTIYSYRLGGLRPIFDDKTLSSWSHQDDDFLSISRATKVQNTQG